MLRHVAGGWEGTGLSPWEGEAECEGWFATAPFKALLLATTVNIAVARMTQQGGCMGEA